jgi:hypothetical protein
MTTDSKIEDLDITVQPIKTSNLGSLPSPPLSQAPQQQELEQKQEGTQGQQNPPVLLRTSPTADVISEGGGDSGKGKTRGRRGGATNTYQ